MRLEDTLFALSEMSGMSGFEYRIAGEIAQMFELAGCEASIDKMGNVIAVMRCGKPNARRIMLDAHMDEIGLMVSDIDERGFLKFVNIGGVDERILPGCEVTVHGDSDIYGIIGIKPPHIQSADENKKVVPIDELVIDIGMDTKAAKGVVSVGDSVTFLQKPFMLGDSQAGSDHLDNGQQENRQLAGKSMDDRAGVAVLLYAAHKLNNTELDTDVYFVASVQEETNMTGAITAAYAIDPHAALVIDVTHGITNDNSDRAFALGEGVSMSVGPNVHPKLNTLIHGIANKLCVSAAPEIDGGSTGTNAWAVQVSREGVPTAVISVPLKYMHSPTEVLSIGDLQACADIVAEFAVLAGKECNQCF